MVLFNGNMAAILPYLTVAIMLFYFFPQNVVLALHQI